MNSRAKGARGEREFRDVLRAAGYCKARRGQQFSGGSDSPDVVCEELPSVHFEVKRCERGNPYDWIEQAHQDAMRTEDHAWQKEFIVVAHKRNNCAWLAILPMDQLLEILGSSDLPAVDTRPPWTCKFCGAENDGPAWSCPECRKSTATGHPGAIKGPSSAHLDCFGPSDGKGKVNAPEWRYTGKK